MITFEIELEAPDTLIVTLKKKGYKPVSVKKKVKCHMDLVNKKSFTKAFNEAFRALLDTTPKKEDKECKNCEICDGKCPDCPYKRF